MCVLMFVCVCVCVCVLEREREREREGEGGREREGEIDRDREGGRGERLLHLPLSCSICQESLSLLFKQILLFQTLIQIGHLMDEKSDQKNLLYNL